MSPRHALERDDPSKVEQVRDVEKESSPHRGDSIFTKALKALAMTDPLCNKMIQSEGYAGSIASLHASR
jgi:hypothetical protein